MRVLFPLALVLVMAALVARAAALVLDDALVGAMAGVLVFLPLLVAAAPFLAPRSVPIRTRRG